MATLAETYRLSPDQLSEQQIRSYIVAKRKALATGSMRPIVSAIKFFYRVTVPRDWPTLQAIRLPKSHTIPVVLPPETCWKMIGRARPIYKRAAMQVAFTCGLRSVDVLNLKPADIRSDVQTLHIKRTKRNRERLIPIPISTIEILRQTWMEHRNPDWIFPSRGNLKNISQAENPISPRTLQRAVEVIAEQIGLAGKGVVFHTLRHSYATTLLDEGVNLRVLSDYMGHQNLQATEVYLHLTPRADANARRIVHSLFQRPADPEPNPNPKLKNRESDSGNGQ